MLIMAAISILTHVSFNDISYNKLLVEKTSQLS